MRRPTPFSRFAILGAMLAAGCVPPAGLGPAPGPGGVTPPAATPGGVAPPDGGQPGGGATTGQAGAVPGAAASPTAPAAQDGRLHLVGVATFLDEPQAGFTVTVRDVLTGTLIPVNATMVAAGGGNIVGNAGGNMVAAGGGNIVGNAGGNMVAAGGGNMVAAGGGNMVAAGGGNMVAAGGGNIVGNAGGNMVAAGGGNLAGPAASAQGFATTTTGLFALDLAGLAPGSAVRVVVSKGAAQLETIVTAEGATLQATDVPTIVAAGGGNMVAAGGGNIVGNAGGNMVAAGGGNMVAAGGGNMVAAGGGNIVGNAGANYVLAQTPPAANEQVLMKLTPATTAIAKVIRPVAALAGTKPGAATGEALGKLVDKTATLVAKLEATFAARRELALGVIRPDVDGKIPARTAADVRTALRAVDAVLPVTRDVAEALQAIAKAPETPNTTALTTAFQATYGAEVQVPGTVLQVNLEDPAKPTVENIYGGGAIDLATGDVGDLPSNTSPPSSGGGNNAPAAAATTTAVVDTYAELAAALADTSITTITLGANISLMADVDIDRAVTIDGTTAKYKLSGEDLDVSGDDVTFESLRVGTLFSIQGASDFTATDCDFLGRAGDVNTDVSVYIGSGTNLVFDGGTVSGKETGVNLADGEAIFNDVDVSTSTNTPGECFYITDGDLTFTGGSMTSDNIAINKNGATGDILVEAGAVIDGVAATDNKGTVIEAATSGDTFDVTFDDVDFRNWEDCLRIEGPSDLAVTIDGCRFEDFGRWGVALIYDVAVSGFVEAITDNDFDAAGVTDTTNPAGVYVFGDPGGTPLTDYGDPINAFFGFPSAPAAGDPEPVRVEGL